MINVVKIEAQPQNVDSGTTQVAFISDDQKSYDATFTHEARRHLLSVLQIEESRHLGAKELALTVTDHTVGVSRQGNALVLVTAEIGPIAFRIPTEQIAAVQRSLGQLVSIPQRS